PRQAVALQPQLQRIIGRVCLTSTEPQTSYLAIQSFIGPSEQDTAADPVYLILGVQMGGACADIFRGRDEIVREIMLHSRVPAHGVGIVEVRVEELPVGREQRAGGVW